MATIFKYNNEYYQCVNLKKKLKRLRIDESDIEILFEGELSQSELEKKYLELTQVNGEDDNENDIKLYYFINPKTRGTISSIYPTLEGLGKYGEGFLPTRTVKEFSKAFDEVIKQVEIEHPEWLKPEQHIICGEHWKELIEKRILEELKEYERIT